MLGGELILKPIIIEPIFECAKSIKVCSVEKGYKVSLWSDKDPRNKILEKEVDSDILILDLAGRNLIAGEKLKVIVESKRRGRVSSDYTEVYKIPNPLPTPLYTDPLYIGAECIYIWNVIPFSTVRAWNGTELLAEVESNDTFLLLFLKRALEGTDNVNIDIEICGNTISTKPTNPINPTGSGEYAEKIWPPKVLEPLFNCQRTADLTNLIPGSKFEILADEQKVRELCSPRHADGFILSQILKETQDLKANQEILGLNAESNPVKVKKRAALNIPLIHEPVYEGEEIIYISNVEYSATLEIQVSGTTIAEVDYTGGNQFNLDKLKKDQIIQVRQTICGIPSNWAKVTVHERPRRIRLNPPKIKNPLYHCVEFVKIEDRFPGSVVNLFADGTFIGRGKADLIQVFPLLSQNQNITASQTVGDIKSGLSPPVIVENVPDLPTPKIEEPVETCDSYVKLSNLLPGATVNLFLNNLIIGSSVPTDTSTIVPLGGIKLWPGAEIHASQSLCMKKSGDHTIKVIGYITLDIPWEVHSVNKKYVFKVVTKCPVLSDTKVNVSIPVKLPSKYDTPYFGTDVLTILESDLVIPKGQSSIDFTVKTNKPGVSALKITADNYIQLINALGVAEEWNKNYFWEDIERTSVYGDAPLTIEEIILTEGVSQNVKFTLSPVPWVDWIVEIHEAASNILKINPNKLIIPKGQNSGQFQVTPSKPKQDYEFTAINISPVCNLNKQIRCYVRKAPTKPTPKTVVYDQELYWHNPYLGISYVMANVYPVPNGILKKIKNINNVWGYSFDLWFPKPNASTEDVIKDPSKGNLLEVNKEKTPASLNISDSMANLTIVAVPIPREKKEQYPIFINLTYEIP